MAELSRDKVVDIIDILYIKIMRLNNSYRAMSALVFNGSIEAHFPDVTAGLKHSFAIDAYNTVFALYHSGTYSFKELSKNSVQFENDFSESWLKVCEALPGLKERRNKVICHLNEKQDEAYIDEMIIKFDNLYQELCRLHLNVMNEFEVKEKDIRAMTSDKFERLNDEYRHFDAMIRTGLLEELLRCNNSGDAYYQ